MQNRTQQYPQQHSQNHSGGRGKLLLRYRWALLSSLALHFALILTLLLWYLPGDRSKTTDVAAVDAPTPAAPQVQPASRSGEAPPVAEPRPPVADIPADQIAAAVERAVDDAAKVSDQRRLAELEKKNPARQRADQRRIDRPDRPGRPSGRGPE